MASSEYVPSIAHAASGRPRVPFLLRLALRDLRGGLSGFGIFLACLALGLAAIVGVGSVSRALSDGLAEKGRMILGGDVSLELVQREASDAERQFLAGHGTLSEVALMRAMARKADGEAGLVEIKAVDLFYPSEGEVDLDPQTSVQDVLAQKGGVYGIAADAAILAKLDLKIGDRVEIGSQPFELRAILRSEPDKLAAGVGFGPRVLMSQEGLRATGLLQPGALVKWLYRLRLGYLDKDEAGKPASPSAWGILASEGQVEDFVAAVRGAFPDAGFEIRTRRNVSPQFSRDLKRFTQFLTLVGLTALVIGGVGIANAVQGFVERKKPMIATMKALGATGTFVSLLLLVEVLLAAAIGMAIGVVAGAALPYFAARFAAVLPFPLAPSVYPREIATGVLYGVLTVLAFSLAPLGRAHDVPVSALFRDGVAPQRVWPRRRYLLAVASAALVLAGATVLFADDRRLALIYLAACLGGFGLLRLAAIGFMATAKRVPSLPWLELRLAVGNFHRPGAVTPAVILSLGLGLTLLVALALIDGNLRHALDRNRSERTPSFFFLGINRQEAPDFAAFVKARTGGDIDLVPMLRGRIVALKGKSVETVRVKESSAWVLQGDRGITVAKTAPLGSKIVAGSWWAPDYQGPPLVSMDAEVAAGLGLTLGDEITVNVLGRNVAARLANMRDVDWRSFGINFVMIFPPSAFAGAPFTELATVILPKGSAGDRDLTLLRAVAQTYPSVVSLRVKDALDAIKDVVDRLAVAVRAAAAVALVAATLVLGGALAAGQEMRLYEAVILKTLGATRKRLVTAFVCEFGLLGLTTAIFGVVAGSLAAYGVVRFVLNLDFVWFWPSALLAAGGATAVAILLGLAATWRVLGRKPAPYLRNL